MAGGKERQIALCKELLKPKYSVDRLKTANLRDALPDSFRNLNGAFVKLGMANYETARKTCFILDNQAF